MALFTAARRRSTAKGPMRRWCSFARRRCGYAGRGNGAPVGWLGSGALQLDQFWADRLPHTSRKGTVSAESKDHCRLVAYRLIAPGRRGEAAGDWLRQASAMLNCWGRTSDWPRRISSTPASDLLLQHKDQYSRI